MRQIDFTYNELNETYYGQENGFEFVIQKQDMSREILETANRILTAYPKKIAEMASFLSEETGIQKLYKSPTATEIEEKLGFPIVYLYRQGDEIDGRLTYTNHTLDDIHLIHVTFHKLLEKPFEVIIDR